MLVRRALVIAMLSLSALECSPSAEEPPPSEPEAAIEEPSTPMIPRTRMPAPPAR